MRETKTLDLGGKSFVLTQLGAKDGRQAWLRLAKLMGPGAAALLKTGELPPAALMTAVFTEVIDHLSEDTFEYFVQVFAKHTEVDGARLDAIVDKDTSPFLGDYMLLLEWLIASLKWNFADFLGSLPGRVLPGSPVASQ